MIANTGTKGIAILALRLVAGWAFLFAGLPKLLGAEPFSAFGFLSFGRHSLADQLVRQRRPFVAVVRRVLLIRPDRIQNVRGRVLKRALCLLVNS